MDGSWSELADLVLSLPPGLSLAGSVVLFCIGNASILVGLINMSLQVSPDEPFLPRLRNAVLGVAFALLVIFAVLGLCYSLFYVWRDFRSPFEEGTGTGKVAYYPVYDHQTEDYQNHSGQGEESESC